MMSAASIADDSGQAGTTFDLILIGAGINGAGIARDAAMRGLRVLLLDKGDMASGTTSWSTRLIHGGLRYLEHRELRLVRESLRERERLLHLAPHLVKPLPLLVPLYEGDRRGPRLIHLGMLLYDALSFDKSLARHRLLSRQQALARAPGLAPPGLRGAAIYYDAQVEYPERLTLENVLSARDHGAVVQTYARVDRLLIEDGAVRGVVYTDLLAGDDRAARTARAPITINVTGPWVDQLLRATDGPSTPLTGGTKGSHIIVAPFPGAPTDALYVEARSDGRPFFIIPWNDLYLIGTTDHRYTGDLDDVVATEDELAYLLRETDRIIPGAGLTRDDVLYSYAGIRPLAHVPSGAEGGITRRHVIHDHAAAGLPGLLSIVGGKLTTYRNLAERTVDRVFHDLGRPAPPCRTAQVPLPGAGDHAVWPAFRDDFMANSSLPPRSADHLLRVYGRRATTVVELARGAPDLCEPFDPATGGIAAEIVFAFRHELAQTLTDALLRRTMVGLGPTVGRGPDRAAAAIAGQHLGWDSERVARELADYRVAISRLTPRSPTIAGDDQPRVPFSEHRSAGSQLQPAAWVEPGD